VNSIALNPPFPKGEIGWETLTGLRKLVEADSGVKPASPFEKGRGERDLEG
jgi:hypothetical protein